MKQLLTGLVAEAAGVLQEKSSRRRPPPRPVGADAGPSMLGVEAVARGERVAEALLNELLREAAVEQRARRAGASSPPSASAPLPAPLPSLPQPSGATTATPRSPLGGAPLASAPLASAAAPMGPAPFGLPPAPRAPATGLPPLSRARVSGGGGTPGGGSAAAGARSAAPPPQPVAPALRAAPLLEALLEAQRRAQPPGAAPLGAGLGEEALAEAVAALLGEAAAEGEAMRPTRAWSRLAHRLFNELAEQGPDLPVFGAPTVLPPSLVRRRQEWALREAVARLSPPEAEEAGRASGSVPLDEARQKRALTLPHGPTSTLSRTPAPRPQPNS